MPHHGELRDYGERIEGDVRYGWSGPLSAMWCRYCNAWVRVWGLREMGGSGWREAARHLHGRCTLSKRVS